MPPKWFTNWANSFKKENDASWAKQEEFNKRQEQFNQYVLDVFNRNNLK